jgi:hypothetical protein
MAKSGSFNTSKKTQDYGDLYLTFAWSIKSQDIASNKTVINWSLKGAGTTGDYYYKAGNFKVVINGVTVYSSSTRIELYAGTTVASGTATIAHATDGTKTFKASAEAGIYNTAVNCTGSGSWALDAIPRHGTVSHSLKSKTETTAVINWSSDSTVDYLWYSKDNGSTWTGVNVADGKSGTYTVTGLTANTAYKIKTRIRRKDSQLTTDSGAISVTTYQYPYCMEAPAFVIGDKVTLKFYNPLLKVFDFTIVRDDTGAVIHSRTIGGNTITLGDDEQMVDALYNTIPSQKSARYRVVVPNASNKTIEKVGGFYSVAESKCAPTFTTFTYDDRSAAVTAITGNAKVMVQGLSGLGVTIPSANKMVAKHGATPSKYVATVDDLSVTIPYSSGIADGGLGVIKTSGTKRINVRAYDSRGCATLAHQDITVIPYGKPVINATLTRKNNFENETTLTVKGTYSRVTVSGADKNKVQSVKYKYRESGGTWSEETPLTTTATSGNFTCTSAVFDLDNSKSYEFEIIATDKLSNNTATATVGVGLPIFFISSSERKCYINGKEVDAPQKFTMNGDALETNVYERGRPMLKRCFNGNLASSGVTEIQLPENAVVRNMYGNIYYTKGSLFIPLNYANPSAPVYTYYNVSSRKIVITPASTFLGCEYVVYVEYIIG